MEPPLPPGALPVLRRELFCPVCGYQTLISGEPDCGMTAGTDTVACADCRKLFDVVTSARDHDDAATEWRDIPARCPRRRTHRIAQWTFPGPCPRCHAIMEAKPGGMGVLWDWEGARYPVTRWHCRLRYFPVRHAHFHSPNENVGA